MTKRGDPREASKRLALVVEQEARRVLTESALEGDPQRLADGWERRFIADGERAKEAMELYAELGYEVCADPLRPEDMADDCEDCKLLMLLQFKTIYTRKRPDR
ncbi:MAG: hypothetical protein JSW43_10645 [Gemmatimonadota bacterium]|nr:MAG: hypothetical protein JSW43_10645 [Gemmatimonadota bacterium]